MRNLIIKYSELFSVIVMMSVSSVVLAQQEWSYTQYQFNLYDANSAYAGNHQTLSMSARHRSQWIGLDGAPVTEQISVHAPMAGNRIGVGMRIVSDKIGARRQQLFKSSVAYKLSTLSGQFSFGITAGLLRIAIDRHDLNAFDVNDDQLVQLGIAQVTPLFGAAFLYSSNRFFIGAETGSLNRAAISDASGSLARLYRSANVVAGVLQPIGEQDMLEVSTQIKWSEGQQWQPELNIQYLYRNTCWLGGGYRLGSAWQLHAAWLVTDQFRVGLSYDNTTGKLMSCNQSSAELFLGYTLHKRTAGSVRYF